MKLSIDRFTMYRGLHPVQMGVRRTRMWLPASKTHSTHLQQHRSNLITPFFEMQLNKFIFGMIGPTGYVELGWTRRFCRRVSLNFA